MPLGSLTSALTSDPDLRVLAFTATVSIASGIFFGSAPALQTAHPNIASTLREQAAIVASSSAQVMYRKVLVVVQVAPSLAPDWG
jgi:hypothetical protein